MITGWEIQSPSAKVQTELARSVYCARCACVVEYHSPRVDKSWYSCNICLL